MAPFTSFRSRVAVLPIDNIDTDQIIPARFLGVTDKQGLGDVLFHNWRFRPDGSPEPDFVLNRPGVKGARVLVSGENFGCGSSREHAPWALCDWGFKAVIARSFADIFRNNALKNGLLPIAVPAHTIEALLAPGQIEVTIDLEKETVQLSNGHSVSFSIDRFAKHCLLTGTDELGYLLSFGDAIADYEARQ
ncbi:MAG: 3-isopropylmalate dehydratase small subunit [Proteobacteria bacterium]|nr:3-isopropylmalate dehydratase small subunit [Pseudomonadota bacterium]